MEVQKTTVPYDVMSAKSFQSEPLFTKCCGCIPLRTGCFILGYLNVIFNTLHTLCLLTLTICIGMSNHGFTHLDLKEDASALEPFVYTPYLSRMGILLIVVICANVVWLAVNIACLVGLHKKRPGPIRVYIVFATSRLMLSLAGFVYLIMCAKNVHVTTHGVVSHSFEFALVAYYILVYYIYANQLSREQASTEEKPEVTTNDVVFIYPTKTDKQNLVLP